MADQTIVDFVYVVALLVGRDYTTRSTKPIPPELSEAIEWLRENGGNTAFRDSLPVDQKVSKFGLWGKSPHEQFGWGTNVEGLPEDSDTVECSAVILYLHKGEFYCPSIRDDVDTPAAAIRRKKAMERRGEEEFIQSGVFSLTPGIQLHIVRSGSDKTLGYLLFISGENEAQAKLLQEKYGDPEHRNYLDM